MKSLISLVILTVIAGQAYSADWTYSGTYGPDPYWKTLGYCNGTRQSPIDIVTADVVETDLGYFTLEGYDMVNTNLDFDNNGHGVTVRLHEDLETLYRLSGGGLPSTYVATQFHLHWGSVNTQGSEHLVDGFAYAGELHMVHYDPKYSDLGAALTSLDYDAATVLGFFLQVGAYENTAFNNFLDYIDDVANDGDSIGVGNLPSFPLRSILPFDLSKFYRYNGSLTIPDCYESVIWNVFYEPISISQAQLDKLRGIYGDQVDANNNTLNTVDNFRTVSPVFDRTIYLNTPVDDDDDDDEDMTTPVGGRANVILSSTTPFVFSLLLIVVAMF